MKRWRAALPVLFLLAGCTAAPAANQSASSTRTESPAPAAPPYGVLVDLLSQKATYALSVVSSEGSVVAQQTAAQRTPTGGLDLPYVSTTSNTLYYLNGDSQVLALPIANLGGTPVPVTHLDVGPGMEGAFAVRPDDSRIAVAVLDFNRKPTHLTLYVDDLHGGAKNVIFESDSSYVWPVAWHGGLLVLAHAYGPIPAEALKAAPAQDNPYWAVSYHVVDPKTANRAVLMGACTASGPLSPAGSACIQGGTIDWQGNTTDWSTRDWGQISSAASLSPDGSMVAAADADNPERLDFWRQAGTIASWVDGPSRNDWAGWLDNTHVVVASSTIAGYPPHIVKLSADASAAQVLPSINALGFYAARLPTDIT